MSINPRLNTTHYQKDYFKKPNTTLKCIVSTSTTNAKTSTQIKNFKRHRDISISPLGKRSHIQYDPQMKQPLEVKPYGLYKTTYTYNPQGKVIQDLNFKSASYRAPRRVRVLLHSY